MYSVPISPKDKHKWLQEPLPRYREAELFKFSMASADMASEVLFPGQSAINFAIYD
jgi:hypothetical protein